MNFPDFSIDSFVELEIVAGSDVGEDDESKDVGGDDDDDEEGDDASRE